MGSSTRETVPTRDTASLPRASPTPPTTPATQVAPNNPTATMPDAMGEMTVDSSSPVTGSGGQ